MANPKLKQWRVVGLVTLLVAAGACGGDAKESAGESWTVLHYSMADTDLESFMVADLNEMAEVGSNDGLSIRAFVDRSPEYSDDDALGLGDWVGGRIIDIGADSSEIVEELGDVDSADPANLASFITEGIKAHPADQYALIISDHGASWPGIGPDESQGGNVLDLADLTSGISEGLKATDVESFDLLGFDACLMASYEVASAVAPLARHLVASQELEPGHGWDYRSLSVLAQDPGTSAQELGGALIDGFAGQAANEGTDDSITLSLIDLSQMDAVDEAMTAFAGALAEGSDDIAPSAGRANASTLGFARSPDPTEDGHLRDLGMLATAIGKGATSVRDEAADLTDAIDAAVLKTVDGASTAGATGLSIYFPPTPELADGNYKDVASAASWVGFLNAFYQTGDEIPQAELPTFANRDAGAAVEFADDGVYVSGTFTAPSAENIVEATISYALVNGDGSLTYFGDEFADLDETGEPNVDGYFDLTALKITDGEDTAYAYISLTEAEDQGAYTVDVPMAYYESGTLEGEYQDILLSLTLDAESGDILDATYYVYDDESGTYGELDADPAALLVPEVLTIGADGQEIWEPTTDVGIYADLDTLDYELEDLEVGTALQLDLTITDFGGNTDTISARTVVQ